MTKTHKPSEAAGDPEPPGGELKLAVQDFLGPKQASGRAKRNTAKEARKLPDTPIKVGSMQARIAELLVPNAKHITNTKSGQMRKEQPQLVIDSIRKIVDAVRGGSRQLAR